MTVKPETRTNKALEYLRICTGKTTERVKQVMKKHRISSATAYRLIKQLKENNHGKL